MVGGAGSWCVLEDKVPQTGRGRPSSGQDNLRVVPDVDNRSIECDLAPSIA